MTEPTRSVLLALNRDFYERQAESFAATRDHAWPGWKRVLETVPANGMLLDAGCGNGAFSYHAHRLGNRVLGINIDTDQVRRCDEFRDFLGLDRSRCQFKAYNIYDIQSLNEKFDQIICFETLEHLERDQEVLGLFSRVLNPEGTLHLCTPRLDRRPYFGEVLSTVEDGGHMRLGYTYDLFAEMLGREGFKIVLRDRVVGSLSQMVMNFGRWLSAVPLKKFPSVMREAAAGSMVIGLLPLTWLDEIPLGNNHLCIYVQARLAAPEVADKGSSTLL